jgi:uncharacterized protein (UPF0264 family)
VSGSPIRWVAVAYADADAAGSPSVNDVLDAAIDSQCGGLLVDTFKKGNLTLLDMIEIGQLSTLAKDCHSAGMFFAIAGKLSSDSLKHLTTVPADVIGIRSAACRKSDRTGQFDSGLVAAFKQEIQNRFHFR